MTSRPGPAVPVETGASDPQLLPEGAGPGMIDVAHEGVSVLVHWLVVLALIGQAIALVLRPPEGVVIVGAWAGAVCLLWAIFCLGMGVLRGTRADGRDLPPPVWLAVVATAGCLVSLAVVRQAAGQVGPWPAEVVVGGLLVGSVTVWRGPVPGGVAGGLLALAAVGTSLVGRPPGALLRTPAAGAIPGIALLATALAVALALGVLMRSAGQLQRTLDARDEVLVREQAVRAASEVAAEVERSLHDTALNTLETVAAHGDLLDSAAVVLRCRSDSAQLAQWRSGRALASLADVVAGLRAHALLVGIALEVVERADPAAPPLPEPVLRALLGAGAEALTNVAKHAGVSGARVHVRADRDEVVVVIADEGVGGAVPSPAPLVPQADATMGFGLGQSVAQRMREVGGTALVTTGSAGRGTRLVLSWRPALAATQPVDGGDTALGDDLLLRMAGVGVLIAALLAVADTALVLVGWDAYALPVAALAAAGTPVAVGGWILASARAGHHIGPAHVTAGAGGYLLAGALDIMADPYCSSLLGEGVMLDARAPMLATVLVLAPRPRVLAGLVATVLVGHAAGAVAWHLRWAPCGASTAIAGAFALALLASTWLLVRRIQQVSARVARVRSQAMAAQVRIAAQLSVRAEEEHWVAATLASAQAVLADIADGRLPPADPATRQLCAEEAAFLRGLLTVGRAPDVVRRPARIWLRLLHASGCRTQVRGAFAGCHPTVGTVRQVGAVIDAVCQVGRGSEVTLFGWSGDGEAGLSVTARGQGVEVAGGRIAGTSARVAPGAWCDVEGDTVSVQWQWDVPPGPVGS